MKYSIEMSDSDSMKRIITLMRKHYEIMELMNEDSTDAVEGGAAMYYKIKIEFEEVWS